MTHPHLSVGRRLALGFGLLLLVLIALVAVVSHWHSRSVALQAMFTERIVPLSDYSHRLRDHVLQMAIELRNYAISRSDAKRDPYEAQRDAVTAALNDLRALPKNPESAGLVRDLAQAVRGYLAESERIVREIDAGRGEVLFDNAQLVRLREAVMGPVERLLQLQDDNAAAALVAMAEARNNVSTALVVSAAISALLCIVLGYFTSRSVRRPLKILLALATEMKAGRWQAALRFAPDPGADKEGAYAVRNEMLALRHAFGSAAAALESRERRLRADNEIVTALSASLDTCEVSRAALRVVADHAGAEIGLVYRWNEETRLLEPVATLGLDDAKALGLGEGVPGEAARARRAMAITDIPADSGFAVRLGYDQSPARTVVAVPVVFGGELLGVLVVASLKRLGEQEIGFLEEAAGRMAVGLKNAATYDHLQRLYSDLRQKSEELQAQYEEIQAQNEEIQAQHEEIQSQNEELQAQREEIEAQGEQLREQNERLREHTDDLDRDNTSLQRADERKNEFLGFLAHELRNPMAAISNSLLVIKRSEQRPAQECKALEILERQVSHLTRIIDDLLDITRISRGKIQLSRSAFDLVGMVRDCIEDYRRALDAKGLQLQLELPGEAIWVDGDRTRLCQILGNLLNNAIKFTASGKQIRVAVGVDPERRNVQLTVSDSGIGIEPALLPEVFKPFSQGHSGLARTNAGLGLGLALVKTLVELHGGSVQAFSEGAGHGARFDVRLPVVCEPVMIVREVRGACAPRRILIVEDSIDAADSLRAVLEIEGHAVEVAHDATACFEIAHHRVPEVVLCDIGLPDVDGFEIARRMRSDPRLACVKLIALSGYASQQDKHFAMEAGFDCHLSKPVSMAELERQLRELQPSASH